MSCKIWQVETGKCLWENETEGFVQCVMFNPRLASTFIYGTSRNVLAVVDTRQSASTNALTIRNDAMVNSVYMYRDGSHILSGDAQGSLKTWDIRTGKMVYATVNEGSKKPISHITLCKKTPGAGN